MTLFSRLCVTAADQGAFAQHRKVLGELRALAAAWPTDAIVREHLAVGISYVLDNERGSWLGSGPLPLLDDLRKLAVCWPRDSIIREQLAINLCKAAQGAATKRLLNMGNALLDELRALAVAYHGDSIVRRCLAEGLFGMLKATSAMKLSDQSEILLNELHTLLAELPLGVVRCSSKAGCANIWWTVWNVIRKVRIRLRIFGP
jgi:hypothetical protein